MWPLSEGPTRAGVPTHRHHMCKGSAFPAKTETLQFGFSLGHQPQLPPQLRIRGPGLLCWPSWACHQLQLRPPFPEFQVGGPGAAQSSLIPYSPPPTHTRTHSLTHWALTAILRLQWGVPQFSPILTLTTGSAGRTQKFKVRVPNKAALTSGARWKWGPQATHTNSAANMTPLRG